MYPQGVCRIRKPVLGTTSRTADRINFKSELFNAKAVKNRLCGANKFRIQ